MIICSRKFLQEAIFIVRRIVVKFCLYDSYFSRLLLTTSGQTALVGPKALDLNFFRQPTCDCKTFILKSMHFCANLCQCIPSTHTDNDSHLTSQQWAHRNFNYDSFRAENQTPHLPAEWMC